MKESNNADGVVQKAVYKPGDIVEVEIPLHAFKRSTRQIRQIINQNDWSFYSEVQKEILLEIAQSDTNISALFEGHLERIHMRDDLKKVFREHYNIIRGILNSFGLYGKCRPFLITSNERMAGTGMYMGHPLTSRINSRSSIQFELTQDMLKEKISDKCSYVGISFFENIFADDIIKKMSAVKKEALDKITAEFLLLIHTPAVAKKNVVDTPEVSNDETLTVTKIKQVYKESKKVKYKNIDYVEVGTIINEVRKKLPASDTAKTKLNLKFFKEHGNMFIVHKEHNSWFVKPV